MMVRTLIERKRNGGDIAPLEWRELMAQYGAGAVPDYQMAALAMAIYFRGLTREETGALTEAMLRSGDRLDLSHLDRPRVDKHSTGGVGDKTSLLLAPLISALGVAVPMMSGRGLGHTGGTLDKLESIPGFRTGLTLAEATRQIERLGCAMLGQTAEVAPADRRLYALRDATATVESIPLIAASIMSKKLAEGLTGLVLDVKVGSGAFMPELSKAQELARTMIALGADHGCPTVAVLTAMDRPLGRACGNALEVRESILGLRGEGPDDLMEVTFALGADMLRVAGAVQGVNAEADARTMMQQAIDNGTALTQLRRIIEAQSGNARVIDDMSLLPAAPVVREVKATEAGTIAEVAPRAIGHGIIAMGGGRTKVEDTVDPAVGYELLVAPGARVDAGDVLALVHARDAEGARRGEKALRGAIRYGEGPEVLPLVVGRIG